MLPETVREAIFTTIPREALGKTAAIEWADLADIPAALRRHPIVVSLRISSDVVDGRWTSASRLAGIEHGTDDQAHTHDQYRLATLTIDVHARTRSGSISGVDLIDAYMDGLQIWALAALPNYVNVAADNGTLDLSYLEMNAERRQTSFLLRYHQAAARTLPNINDIGAEIITE